MKLEAKNYFVLLCNSGVRNNDPLICGVFASKKEAQDIAQTVKDCPAKHKIKKCDVVITILKENN